MASALATASIDEATESEHEVVRGERRAVGPPVLRREVERVDEAVLAQGPPCRRCRHEAALRRVARQSFAEITKDGRCLHAPRLVKVERFGRGPDAAVQDVVRNA